MNENPDPRDPGEDDLASALGDALRAAPDDLVMPPPVTDIAERAAAKARARNARRTLGSVAASVLLVAGGVAVWNTANDGGPDQLEAAVESVDEDETEAAADIESAPPDDAAATSELVEARPLADIDPAEYSTGPGLEWTEIPGPADRGGSLMTLPDGRVMVRAWSDAGAADRVLVTSDGTTWDEVPLPAGVSPNFIDLGDEIWVVTGWNVATAEFGDGVYISSDQGASWQEVEVPGVGESSDSYLVTRSYVGGAATVGDQAVVLVSAFTDIDVAQIAIDQGIATSRDEVRGWGTDGDETGITRLTIDIGEPFPFDAEIAEEGQPSAIESFEFDPVELGLPTDPDVLYGPGNDEFTVAAGDVGGLTEVARFDGSPATLVSAGGLLTLSAFGETGPLMWSSPDGTTWTPVDVGSGFELAGRFQGELWGGGWSPDGLVVQRLTGGVVETVATFPGLSLNSIISVGPSGLAGTVVNEGAFMDAGGIPVEGEEFPVDGSAVLPPGVMAAQDGIELRVEDDGTGTLIDTNSDEVLREFSFEEMNADEPPAGVIETDDGVGFSLRIEDPVTGEELVTFSIEDYTDFEGAVTTGNSSSGFSVEVEPAVPDDGFFEAGEGTTFVEGGGFIAPENWVAWSANGSDWNFERATEAFGLAEDQEAWTQVAVGDGYVLASIEIFSTSEDPVAETGNGLSTARWFIAATG
ncbi:MAG: hypothetical protein AAF480_00790 [Actinomycetota bacterium]